MAAKPLLSLAFIASLLIGLGYSMTTTISPQDIVETVTKSAEISCTPDDVGGDVKSVESIEITKDGQELIALVRPCAKPDCTLSSSADIKAEGAIGADASKSHLKATITDPVKNHTGEYSCKMKYLDKTNLIKEDMDPKMMDVGELDAKSMQPLLDNLTKRVEDLEAQAGVGPGAGKPGSYKNPECIAAFAVTNKAVGYNAQMNKNLILPDEITNKGKGYDIKTGVFTAPCNGLYNFNLAVALSQKLSGTIVQLRKNNDVIFRIYAADRTYDDQASSSAVVFLNKGDKVSAFVEAISGSKIYDSKGYTIFSGYLAMRIE